MSNQLQKKIFHSLIIQCIGFHKNGFLCHDDWCVILLKQILVCRFWLLFDEKVFFASQQSNNSLKEIQFESTANSWIYNTTEKNGLSWERLYLILFNNQGDNLKLNCLLCIYWYFFSTSVYAPFFYVFVLYKFPMFYIPKHRHFVITYLGIVNLALCSKPKSHQYLLTKGKRDLF